MIVSIPYRLATNYLFDTSSAANIMFQFLIGWLQTHTTPNYTLVGVDSFNSLQVGYKPKQARQYSRLFQEKALPLVSIPYRLATNVETTVWKVVDNGVVSIPYRLATNQKSEKDNRKQQYCFNSLQVGYKHYPRVTVCTTFKVFQFLIGWLQTM